MTTPSPFELGEDQRALRDLVRRVAEEKVAPRAAEIDATGDFCQLGCRPAQGLMR